MVLSDWLFYCKSGIVFAWGGPSLIERDKKIWNMPKITVFSGLSPIFSVWLQERNMFDHFKKSPSAERFFTLQCTHCVVETSWLVQQCCKGTVEKRRRRWVLPQVEIFQANFTKQLPYIAPFISKAGQIFAEVWFKPQGKQFETAVFWRTGKHLTLEETSTITLEISWSPNSTYLHFY